MTIARIIDKLTGKTDQRKNQQERINGDREIEVVSENGAWVTWAGRLRSIPHGKYAGVHAIERAPHSDRRIDPTLINVVSNEKGVFAATIDNQQFNERFGFELLPEVEGQRRKAIAIDAAPVDQRAQSKAAIGMAQWYADNPEIDEHEAQEQGYELREDHHGL